MKPETAAPSLPVIIVGGGPVGMALAMNLDALGVRSVVLDSEPRPRWHPKGSTQNSYLGPTESVRVIDPYTVELSKWSSWRPRIFLTVRAVPHGDSGGVVTVWARADGWERAKARRIANAVLTAIPGATPLH